MANVTQHDPVVLDITHDGSQVMIVITGFLTVSLLFMLALTLTILRSKTYRRNMENKLQLFRDETIFGSSGVAMRPYTRKTLLKLTLAMDKKISDMQYDVRVIRNQLHKTRPDQTRPDQTGPDQTRPDRTRPDQTRLDQTGPDQTRPDQTRPDQTRPDQTRPDQTRPDQTRPDQTRPDQTRPDQTRPDQTRPDRTRPDQTRPDQTRPDRTRPDQTRPDQTRPQSGLGRPVQPTLAWKADVKSMKMMKMMMMMMMTMMMIR
ncbi:hypothetical protein Ahia01_000963700 [Argonauta hians]